MKNEEYDELTKSLLWLTQAARILRTPRKTVEVKSGRKKEAEGEVTEERVVLDNGSNPYLFLKRVTDEIDSATRLATIAENDFASDSKSIAPVAVRDFVQARRLFLLETSKPIDGCKKIFDKLRFRVERIPIESLDTNDSIEPKRGDIDFNEAEFIKCFNNAFKRSERGTNKSKLADLCSAIRRGPAFSSKRAWGAIALALQESKYVTNEIKNSSFTEWVQRFFDILNLDPPKYCRKGDFQLRDMTKEVKEFVADYIDR